MSPSALVSLAAILALGTASFQAAPAQSPARPAATPATPATSEPAAPKPQATAETDPFPAANLKFFNADSPSTPTVESFLHAIWGYDENRTWRVEAIQKTAAPGVARIVVYVKENAPNAKVQAVTFYVTPDGKHAIADAMVDFGATPFADRRQMLQERATGAYKGAASKDLELVEFADLQCPHCKEAQPVMDQLVHDFPTARIVYQLFPLTAVHPAAFQAAADGLCVAKQGNAAFFTYAQAVYDTQDALTPDGTTRTLAAAIAKAGLDPAVVATCAATPAIKDAVNADIKLAEDAGVNETPTLVVNGRPLPLLQIPYEQLKKMILFQAGLDGLHIPTPQPTLTNLGK
jgi:protein-disulfide isomerase